MIFMTTLISLLEKISAVDLAGRIIVDTKKLKFNRELFS